MITYLNQGEKRNAPRLTTDSCVDRGMLFKLQVRQWNMIQEVQLAYQMNGFKAYLSKAKLLQRRPR